MQNPSAIIFINADINDGIKNKLISQLQISENMSGTEFDARYASDPNYLTIIHANHLRILVIRETFVNSNLADIVMFVKQGLASILKTNFGPPGLTYQIDRINIYDLLRYNNSSQVTIYPQPAPLPSTCRCSNCLGGIFSLSSNDTSGVHCVNPDNIYNNSDFINRK